jgi:hypothetical protein
MINYMPAPGIGPFTPSGARLPSILRLASCFSAMLGLFFGMSGRWLARLGLWPIDIPTRTYIAPLAEFPWILEDQGV